MRHVLDSIKHLPASDNSKGSNLSDITGKIVSLMQGDNTKLQIPTEDGTAPDFNFFPILGDFKQEEKLLKFYLNFAPTAKPVDFYTSIYCGYGNFLRDTSKLSYYGDDASSRHSDAENSLRQMTGDNKPDCRSWNQTLNTVATATQPAAITKTNSGGWSQTAAVEVKTRSIPTPLLAPPAACAVGPGPRSGANGQSPSGGWDRD